MIEEDISELQRQVEQLRSMLYGLCDKLQIVCPYSDHDWGTSRYDHSLGEFIYRCTWCDAVQETGEKKFTQVKEKKKKSKKR